MVQKFYAIKSESSIHKGTIISTTFAFIVAGGSYFLGGFGRLFETQQNVDANGYDSIIPLIIGSLPDLLIGIVVLLVLSASMSTLSSLVMASSSTLTIDFIKDNIIKNMSDRAQLFSIRILIVVFILISVVIALIQYNSSITFIAQLMGISWGALAGSFLGPMIYSLYWKKTTKIACWTSFIFGSGIMTMVMLCPQIFPTLLQSPINAGAFAMIISVLIVPLVSKISPKPSEKLIENCFSCYETTAVVKLKVALPDDNVE